MEELDFDRVIDFAQKRASSVEAISFYFQILQANFESPPHAHPAVLHSAGVCVSCDHYAVLQEFRRSSGLPFTNELSPEEPILPGQPWTRAQVERTGANLPQ